MSCNPLQLIFCFITGCVVYTHSTISGIQYKSYQRFP